MGSADMDEAAGRLSLAADVDDGAAAALGQSDNAGREEWIRAWSHCPCVGGGYPCSRDVADARKSA